MRQLAAYVVPMLICLLGACGSNSSGTRSESDPHGDTEADDTTSDGISEAEAGGGNHNSQQSSNDETSTESGAPNEGSDEPEPAHAEPPGDLECNPGERREAMAGEDGSECVCQDIGFWACYGVSDSRAIGGDATCKDHLSITQGDCVKSWGNCDDRHTYMVTCPRGVCLCIVDATIVGELEPGTECPQSIAEANRACGWNLDRDN